MVPEGLIDKSTWDAFHMTCTIYKLNKLNAMEEKTEWGTEQKIKNHN